MVHDDDTGRPFHHEIPSNDRPESGDGTPWILPEVHEVIVEVATEYPGWLTRPLRVLDEVSARLTERGIPPRVSVDQVRFVLEDVYRPPG